MPQIDHVAGAQLPVEAAGPEILAIRCTKQLDVDLKVTAVPADAALQHVVDAPVQNAVGQGRPGAATEADVEDVHVPEADQGADHFLGGAVGEDIARWVAAVVRERQDYEPRALPGGCPPVPGKPHLEPGQSGEARIFLIQDDNLTAEVPLRRSILQSTLRQKYRSTGRHNPQRDGGPEKGLYRLHPIALAALTCYPPIVYWRGRDMAMGRLSDRGK